MTDPRPFSLAELLDFQARVVSRSQVLDHGLSGNAVSRRAKSGNWQRLQRGTYAAFSGVPPREACLVRQELPPWQLPRTPVAETVLDQVAASASFDDAYSWLSRATGRRLVSAETIKVAMAARKRMRWRGWLTDALDDVADGVMFPLELRYVRDVERAHGLPAARRQARRELAGGVRYLDNFYDVYRLCVELDGRSSHPPEQKWQDADRDNDNLFAGDVQTLRFGVRDVTVRRCARAGQLAAALMRRGWDGAGLHACGTRCQVTVRNSPGSAEVPRIRRSS